MLRSIACLLLALLLPLSALAQSRGTDAVADSWIGRDASELLVQWPIDRGFYTSEDAQTGETAYSFNFGAAAYSYNKPVGSTVAPGPGGLTQTYYYETVNVAAQHHCEIVFYANADGIITRYAYDSRLCRRYVRSWGRPKGR